MLRRGTILVYGDPPRPTVVTSVRGDDVELVMLDARGVYRPVISKTQARLLLQVPALKSRWFDPQSVAVASLESINLNSGRALLRRLIRRPRHLIRQVHARRTVLASGLYRFPLDLGTFLRFQYVPPLENSLWIETGTAVADPLVIPLEPRVPTPAPVRTLRPWPPRDSILYRVIKDKFWQVVVQPIDAGPSLETLGQGMVRGYRGPGGVLESFLVNHTRVELPQPGERFVGPFGNEVRIVRATLRSVTCESAAHGPFVVPLSAFVYDYVLPNEIEPGHLPDPVPSAGHVPHVPLIESTQGLSFWDMLSESAGLRSKPG